MNEISSGSRSVGGWVLAAAIVVGACTVLSAHFIAEGYVKSKEQMNLNVAAVNGTAEEVVNSDRAKWSVYLTRSSATSSKEVIRLLKEDEKALRDYLTKNGIVDPEISVHPLDLQPSSFTSYGNQTIVIESNQAEKLGSLASEAQAEFSKSGRSLTTNSIEFFYAELSNLQRQLTKRALEDARSQAKDLFGTQLDRIQSIGTASLTLTPEHASSASYDYGYRTSDTSSVKKKVLVSVNVSFLLK